MARPVSWTFRDCKGQVARTKMYVAASAATFEAVVESIRAAFAAMSNADVRSSIDNPTAVVIPEAGDDYLDVADKAAITFTDASGALHTIQVPAPKQDVFLADQETVDGANAGVAALVALVIVDVTSKNGVAYTGFVGGLRRRGPMPRKFNIYTQNPQLSGPGE